MSPHLVSPLTLRSCPERYGRPDRRDHPEQDPVGSCPLCPGHVQSTNVDRGYVALAVAGDNGTASKDLDTGCGKDRQANMLAFAVQALTLAKAFIVGDAKM
jgi:hypothetical protein